jgi:hypothetical protein
VGSWTVGHFSLRKFFRSKAFCLDDLLPYRNPGKYEVGDGDGDVVNLKLYREESAYPEVGLGSWREF